MAEENDGTGKHPHRGGALRLGPFFVTKLDADSFKHVGFGGSIGRTVLDVEIDDDDLFWDVNHRFHGVVAYVAVYS